MWQMADRYTLMLPCDMLLTARDIQTAVGSLQLLVSVSAAFSDRR